MAGTNYRDCARRELVWFCARGAPLTLLVAFLITKTPFSLEGHSAGQLLAVIGISIGLLGAVPAALVSTILVPRMGTLAARVIGVVIAAGLITHFGLKAHAGRERATGVVIESEERGQ